MSKFSLDRKTLLAHGAMILAMVIVGLMPPFSKDAMNSGITGVQMATLRICGSAILYWVISLFAPKEHLAKKDYALILVASIFGIIGAQGGLMLGISRTSPINAAMEISTQPIFALILAAIVLHEKVTIKSALGVTLGFAGAAILIFLNTGSGTKSSNIVGDAIVLGSQASFAFYLTFFGKRIKKFGLITFNRWLFTFASILLLPFTFTDMMALDVSSISAKTFAEIGYIVFFCTFFIFVLLFYCQRKLSSTVISTYNYLQPFVAVVASLLMGLAVLCPQHILSGVLIFTGVWLVISKKKN
jgi:drug/metabolite transporter (DMT)-like permease